MALLQISEVFGNDTSIGLESEKRKTPFCRFQDTRCTKQGIEDPLGTCSFSDGQRATVVCPARFLDGRRLFTDAGRAAFGTGRTIIAVPEVRLLDLPRDTAGRIKRIGKVDFLLALLDDKGSEAIDFAALEIQAVYISGRTIRPAYRNYLETGELRATQRRVDFRSSAQKRLMPQLGLKVPIFRRWGKKFFVAMDTELYGSLPKMSQSTPGNSEVTWLVYPFDRQVAGGYSMGDPEVHNTTWDAVIEGLREGKPPEKDELLKELTKEVPKRIALST